ncbi:MAG: hypothetical protein IT536_13855 [Hyphomicrobiales bacterium]|nr:hypothetical protein [Hyphomicrobiales bacterium]
MLEQSVDKAVLDAVEPATNDAFQAKPGLDEQPAGGLVAASRHGRHPLAAELVEGISAQGPQRAGQRPTRVERSGDLDVEAAPGVIDDASDQASAPDHPERAVLAPAQIAHMRNARANEFRHQRIGAEQNRSDKKRAHRLDSAAHAPAAGQRDAGERTGITDRLRPRSPHRSRYR